MLKKKTFESIIPLSILVILFVSTTLSGFAYAHPSKNFAANAATTMGYDLGFINITVSTSRQMISSTPNLVVLDVRTLTEYKSGHIKKAIVIPVTELERRMDELDKRKETLVYCGKGGRSTKASQILAEKGFTMVYNMLDGLEAWIDAGYPVTPSPKRHSIRDAQAAGPLNPLIDGAFDSGKLVFLYFYAEWCHFCQRQLLIIEELEREYSDEIAFVRVDSFESPEAVEQFGVRGFPTMFLIFDKNAEGYEYRSFRGYTEKSLLIESIDSLIVRTDDLISPVAESVDTLESADLSREMAGQTPVVETEPEDIVPTQTVYYCKDCADCNSKIAAASPGDTVVLTADILDQVGSCINIANTGVIFDGGGYTIDGDGVGTDEYGVGIIGRPKNTVRNCKITDFYYGIYLLDRADNTLITENEVGTEEVPNKYGIYIWGCNEVLVKDNLVRYNELTGIHVKSDGWGNSIKENKVIANRFGIILAASRHNTIERNSLVENGYGIYLYSSNNNTVIRNEAKGNIENGILSYVSHNNTVNDNIANSNDVGIYLLASNGTTLTGNTANYNSQYGIFLSSSSDNQVVDNTANYNTGAPDTFGMRLDYGSNNNNVTLNTINYNGGLGGLGVYRSSYNYIVNNTVLHNDYYGVWMRECHHNELWWNTFSFNQHGIYLVYTTFYIYIFYNRVENNREYGIRLEHCNYTYILVNKVNSNKHGIYLWGDSDLNNVWWNQIVHNDQHGVYFQSTSNNCTLYGNVICRNLIDIKDNDANSGDENTCNTPDGWNDDGTTGCTYSCPLGWCYDYNISEWINPPTTGDWNVDHVIECNDTEITLNGDLRISGELRFNHVKLMMNVANMEDLANIYKIEVRSGGAFYINSRDTSPSIVTNGLNASAYYTFQVKSGSTFEMRNSELHNCGFAWNKPNLNLAGLWIATDSVIIENNLIDHNFAGMIFYNSGNHRIFNNTINLNDWFGIYGLNSPYNEIELNEIGDNGKHPLALAGGGIRLSNASHSIITDNTVTSNSKGDGIALSGAPNSIITNNVVNSNSYDGISLSGAPSSIILNNIANSNGYHGITVSSSGSTEIIDNTANWNHYDGIALSNSPGSHIAKNTANSNWDDGIAASSSDGTEIVENTVDGNGDDGIVLYDSPRSNIADNTPDGDGDCGIYVYLSSDTNITRNTANWNNHGIYVSWSFNTRIIDNIANFNRRTARHSTGIYVISSSHSTININTANSNWRGIYLQSSTGTTIGGNIVSSNTLFGIHLFLSDSNVLSDNIVDSSTGEWDSAAIYLSNSEHNEIINNQVSLSWFGIVLWESPHANILLNEVHLNNNTGISLEQFSGHSFIGFNNVTFNYDGISLITSHYVAIEDNNATLNGVGISLAGSDWAHIFHNNASDNSWTGISLSGSNHNTIRENSAERNKHGISLSSSSSNVIFNNTARFNHFGLSLRWSSNHNDVVDNDARSCIDYGAYLFRAHLNFVNHNDFGNSGSVGVYLERSDNNHIIDNDVASATNYGINLFESHENLIHVNDVRSSNDVGIELSSSNTNSLANNTAQGCTVGISIRFSSENAIVNNGVSGNNMGVSLLRSDHNGIFGNNASANSNVGIELSLSDDNEIIDNVFEGNSNYGIHLYSSERNHLENNDVNLNGVGIYFDWSVHNIVVRNTANYNELTGIALYWSSDHNRILSNQVGFNLNVSIRVSSSSYNLIASNDASMSAVGILLDWSKNNIIQNNTANSNTYHGISLDWFSNNNDILNNTATNSMIGIALDMSRNNTMFYNNASFNNFGISLEWSSDDNLIASNVLDFCNYGISLHWSSNSNEIRNNEVGYNGVYGIHLYNCTSNIIYHNDILNNTIQAYDDGVNAWDDGYPSGGNYWSDYTGEDFYSGPYQNETGSDGIGDTPYPIDEDTQDNYPLMHPWIPEPITAIHGLTTTIESWNLSRRAEKPLTTSLEKAARLLEEGYETRAIRELNFFIRLVQVFHRSTISRNTQGLLTDQQADQLITTARATILAVHAHVA